MTLLNHKGCHQSRLVNGTDSDPLQISSGVPGQGSILGPILFPIYDNDTQFMSKLIRLLLYADDMNVLVSHENVNTLMICGEERTSCSLGLDVKQIDD